MPVRSPITRTFAGKAVSMSAPNPETNRQIGTAPRRRPDMQRLVAMALGLFVASMVLLASPLLAREAQGMAFRNTREQGAVGKYDARTFGVYQNVDDSGKWGVAYCIDQHKDGPLASVGYAAYGKPDQVLSYLMAHGYPNATTICGRAFSPGEARAVTQMAIWQCCGGNVVSECADIDGCRTTALQFLEEAQAYQGPPFSCGTIWTPEDGRYQDVLLTTEANMGWLKVVKSSADRELSDGNPCYALDKACYQVFRDEACTDLACELWTGTDGSSEEVELPVGRYYLRESHAPHGYLLDVTVHAASVERMETRRVELCEEPGRLTHPFEIEKHDGDIAINPRTAEGDALLEDAEFEVRYFAGRYDDVAGLPYVATRTWTIRTRRLDDGRVAAVLGDEGCKVSGADYFRDPVTGGVVFPLGTYAIRESKAPQGYSPSSATCLAWVTTDGTTTSLEKADGWATRTGVDEGALAFLDMVRRGGLAIEKLDAETKASRPLGAASLAGARFKLENASDGPVVVRGTPYPPDATIDCLELVTDENGHAETAADDLPYGSYRVTELSAPEGYLLPEGFTQTIHVHEEGVLVKVPFSDMVKRGDLHLRKKVSDGADALAGVPFRITSTTTGESHIVVTDENGVLDTRTSRIAHSEMTNANDGAKGDDYRVCGTWFSGAAHDGAAVRDDLGALPYDTYRLEELRCKTNEGRELVTLAVTVSRDSYAIDMGTVDDKNLPSIRTSVTTLSTDGGVCAAGETHVTDVIDFAYVTPLTSYSLVGTLVDRTTGQAVLDSDGKPVSSRKDFVSKSEYGTESVEFTFDSTLCGDRDVVVFERLLKGDVEVARHDDPNDKAQTFHVRPSIQTEATDATDADHEIPSCSESAITDSVHMEGLYAGASYSLVGTLVDGVSGEELKDEGGQSLSQSMTFTARSSTESHVLEFRLPAHVGGSSVVVFERLMRNGRPVANHCDVGDPSQTLVRPSIHTEAALKGGGRERQADASETVTDRVSFEGLQARREYRLVGVLVDRADGSPLKANGAQAEVKFTPQAAVGTQELRFDVSAEVVAGRRLVVFERLYQSDELVATHESLEDEGQFVSFPKIETMATDALDGDHLISSCDVQTVCDLMSYEGLEPGAEYVASGTLRDRDSGEELVGGDGTPFGASVTFVPAEPSGSVEVRMDVDATALAGKTVVAFERLAREGRVVAAHEDLGDADQSVFVSSIHTIATDRTTGEHSVRATRDEMVVDHVSYHNLVPGREYHLEGHLVDRGDGKALGDARGVSFVPEEGAGEVIVELPLDAEGLEGRAVVAFERLFDEFGPVAAHEDLEDDDQAVCVGDGPSGARRMPQTGTMSIDWMRLALCAAAILGGVALWHRGRR